MILSASGCPFWKGGLSRSWSKPLWPGAKLTTIPYHAHEDQAQQHPCAPPMQGSCWQEQQKGEKGHTEGDPEELFNDEHMRFTAAACWPTAVLHYNQEQILRFAALHCPATSHAESAATGATQHEPREAA